jgi:hypothetical protein
LSLYRTVAASIISIEAAFFVLGATIPAPHQIDKAMVLIL